MHTAKTAKSDVNVVHLSDMWVKKFGDFTARITERGEIALYHPAFYPTRDSFVEFKDLLPKYLVHDFAACELVLSRFPHSSDINAPHDMVRIALCDVLDRIQDGELLVLNAHDGVTEAILPKLPINIPVGMKYAAIVHTSVVAGRAYRGFVLDARVLEDGRLSKRNYVPGRLGKLLIPKVVNG